MIMENVRPLRNNLARGATTFGFAFSVLGPCSMSSSKEQSTEVELTKACGTVVIGLREAEA